MSPRTGIPNRREDIPARQSRPCSLIVVCGGGLQADSGCAGQSKMRVMFREFLKRTKKKPSEVASEQLVIDNPDKFVNLA